MLGPAPLLPAALALLGGEYALFLSAGDVPLDMRAAAVGAGLLVTAELGYWALELRTRVSEEAGGHARRTAWIAVIALAGLLLGAGMLTLVDLAGQESVALEAVGALAAIAAAALLLGSLQRGGGAAASESSQASAPRRGA